MQLTKEEKARQQSLIDRRVQNLNDAELKELTDLNNKEREVVEPPTKAISPNPPGFQFPKEN